MKDICLVSIITAITSFITTFIIVSMKHRDPRKPGDEPQHWNTDVTVDL